MCSTVARFGTPHEVAPLRVEVAVAKLLSSHPIEAVTTYETRHKYYITPP